MGWTSGFLEITEISLADARDMRYSFHYFKKTKAYPFFFQRILTAKEKSMVYATKFLSISFLSRRLQFVVIKEESNFPSVCQPPSFIIEYNIHPSLPANIHHRRQVHKSQNVKLQY